MGRISNLEKKRSELFKILETKEKALKRSTYINYYYDILINLPTVNKLEKLKQKILQVPSNGNKINKTDIAKIVKKNKLRLASEINDILNLGFNLASPTVYKQQFRELNKNIRDPYYTKKYADTLKYYFREYIYDYDY